MGSVLAVDVGGTKTAVALVSGGDGEGRILAREQAPTPPDPRAAVALIAQIARRWRDEGALDVGEGGLDVGVGCPGPLDLRAGVVATPPNLPAWHGFALVEELERALVDEIADGPGTAHVDAHGAAHVDSHADALATALPRAPGAAVDGQRRPRVFLENDANAACIGEHRFGAARGVADVVYFTISTGIGAGAIVDGRVLHGAGGNAAELGHLSVKHDGWACACGGRGCIEAFASGPALVKRALAAGLAVDAVDGAAAVLALVRAGQPSAVALWDETVDVLAAGVANAINAFNPKLVVVGGGLAVGAGALLLDRLRERARARAMKPLAAVVDVVPAALGNDAGLLGAAALALDARAREGVPG